MIKRAKRNAKAALQGNWLAAILIFLLFVVLGAALESTGIGAIFTGLLVFGYAAFCLELAKSKKAKLGALFSGIFRGFFKKWGASLLMGLYLFLWSLLFIIPGIVKSYAYSMTYYIMQEKPKMGINEAITESREMMKGHKLQLFLLDLSFTGWMLLSVITLGLALFYAWPYYQTARAEFYKQIKKGAKPAQKK